MEATMEVIINYSRPGKGIRRYIEGLVDDDPVRIKTCSHVSPEFSQKWCEEIWWPNGRVPQGLLIGSVIKYLFYREWYSVMQLLDREEAHLGYYVNVNTLLRKSGGEYYLTDLFLDLWIAPSGKFIELDRDEFEEGYRSRLITYYQYRKANQIIGMLKGIVANRDFFPLIH
jgi:hypothetical protein